MCSTSHHLLAFESCDALHDVLQLALELDNVSLSLLELHASLALVALVVLALEEERREEGAERTGRWDRT